MKVITRFEKATDLMMNDSFSCSQAILEVFCEDFDVDLIEARKLSALFGGGLKSGNVCGLITGALMVLGLKYGQTEPKDVTTKALSGPIAREFIKRFTEMGHDLNCEDLLGINSSTPEGAEYVKANDLHRTICVPLLRDAIEILERMIFDE